MYYIFYLDEKKVFFLNFQKYIMVTIFSYLNSMLEIKWKSVNTELLILCHV